MSDVYDPKAFDPEAVYLSLPQAGALPANTKAVNYGGDADRGLPRGPYDHVRSLPNWRYIHKLRSRTDGWCKAIGRRLGIVEARMDGYTRPTHFLYRQDRLDLKKAQAGGDPTTRPYQCHEVIELLGLAPHTKFLLKYGGKVLSIFGKGSRRRWRKETGVVVVGNKPLPYPGFNRDDTDEIVRILEKGLDPNQMTAQEIFETWPGEFTWPMLWQLADEGELNRKVVWRIIEANERTSLQEVFVYERGLSEDEVKTSKGTKRMKPGTLEFLLKERRDRIKTAQKKASDLLGYKFLHELCKGDEKKYHKYYKLYEAGYLEGTTIPTVICEKAWPRGRGQKERILIYTGRRSDYRGLEDVLKFEAGEFDVKYKGVIYSLPRMTRTRLGIGPTDLPRYRAEKNEDGNLRPDELRLKGSIELPLFRINGLVDPRSEVKKVWESLRKKAALKLGGKCAVPANLPPTFIKAPVKPCPVPKPPGFAEKNGKQDVPMVPSALTSNHKLILSYLVRANRLVDQYELANVCGCTKETLHKRLKPLRDDGLIHRPNGPKGGEGATQAGKLKLKEWPVPK